MAIDPGMLNGGPQRGHCCAESPENPILQRKIRMAKIPSRCADRPANFADAEDVVALLV
jgi:hypothetical protein